MTHLKIQQNTTGIEEVSHSVIEKLYNLAISGDLDASSNLLGRLHTPIAYRSQVLYLTSNYPNLYINSDDYAIPFEDPNMITYLNSIGVGSNGTVTEAQAAAATVVANSANTTVTKFNELRYFTNITESRGGFSASSSGWVRFTGWTALEEVDISNFTSIGHLSGSAWEDTFSGCTSLKTVTASDRLTLIGWNAFSGCTNLESITGLTGNITVSGYAFSNCVKLPQSVINNVTFKFEPLNVYTNGGLYAFYNTKFTTVTLHLDNTFIPSCCFLNCTALTSVNIPQGCSKIENNAFDGCTSLTNLDLSNVRELYGAAFKNCTSLRTLDLSNLLTVPSNNNPFAGCTGLTSITISEKLLNCLLNIFSAHAINPAVLTTFIIKNPDLWTIFNQNAFPCWSSRCYFDVLSFPNATTAVTSSQGLCARGNDADSLKQLYVPSITIANSNYDTYYHRYDSAFGTHAQEYLNSGQHKRINLLYFKDLTTLLPNCFYGLVCNALVINNTTPPTCTTAFHELFNEYRAEALNVNIDSWGNLEDATDPTAAIQYSSGSWYQYADKQPYVKYEISFIYVPDSAVNTYKAATGWGSVASKIKGISELNGGVKYATKADWEAAGKPLALIEEYM